MNSDAIVFLAWGEKCVSEVRTCIQRSKPYFNNCDIILITDEYTKIDSVDKIVNKIIRVKFSMPGLLRKTEIFKFLPDIYKRYLFLDSDTAVIQDISLGFIKANIHGIAICPASHYSLNVFMGFERIMRKEGVPILGQLQYNTGVIFFKNSAAVKDVFNKWESLAIKHLDFSNDQPFFTLAMDLLGFNPYTLSISYNYRGFGDPISGDIRVWHSRGEMPPKINENALIWPLRRAWPNRLELSQNFKNNHMSHLLSKIKMAITSG
jgi:hypothetical protein